MNDRDREILDAIKAKDRAILESVNLDELWHLFGLFYSNAGKLYQENQELKKTNEKLCQEMAERHGGGRKPQYTPTEKAEIIAFYNQKGETYESTHQHFQMSTDTIKRFIKEARANGVYVKVGRRGRRKKTAKEADVPSEN